MEEKLSQKKVIWVIALFILALEWMHHGYSTDTLIHSLIDIPILFVVITIFSSFFKK
jgi:hypothetical protein